MALSARVPCPRCLRLLPRGTSGAHKPSELIDGQNRYFHVRCWEAWKKDGKLPAKYHKV